MSDSTFLFKLADGRQLSFAEYGAPSGMPVLFCHGAPGSRWQIRPGMAEAARQQGVRIIAPERPGYGLSDNQPGREILDWPKDVSELMDHLGIMKSDVWGYSMGGAYALACGYALSGRVSKIRLVSSIAPNMFQPEVTAKMAPSVMNTVITARDNPDALVQFLNSLRGEPEQFLALYSPSLPPPDQAALTRPEVKAGLLLDCEAALCQGGYGMVRDFTLASRNWSFPLEKINAEVSLWHGTEDINAPAAMSEYLAERLPNSHCYLLPGEGHLTYFTHQFPAQNATGRARNP